MYEVEVKVPADVDRVADRLDDIDADHVDSVEQIDTYYDAPHREFAETDEALRIRAERHADDETTKVTYKGPLVETESKSREEFETAVAERDALEGILSGLGFEPAATVRKDRERYAVAEFIVTLDTVEDVGEFVEVETDVETEAEVEAAREGANELLERLGLDPEDGIRTSYLGLLLAEDG
jgi:adenylate cyclase class 2